MLTRWLALAILALSGCNGECVDGVCPSFDLTARFPGPCESALAGEKHATHCAYRYDGARLAEIECSWWNDVYGDDDRGETVTTWTYDAGGQPVRVARSMTGRGYQVAALWQLDTDPITYAEGSTIAGAQELYAYDRSTFAFLPMPGGEAALPRAELGLLRAGDATFSWSGSGTSLTRTSSTGVVVTFVLDDRGRVVQRSGAGTDATWTFDGDLLRKYSSVTMYPDGSYGDSKHYVYDRLGNLATADTEHARPPESPNVDQSEAYAYDCW